jgi:hypothetical protein
MLFSYVTFSWTDFEPNSYFKMINVATQGGTITTYSDRFTITGMTGTSSPPPQQQAPQFQQQTTKQQTTLPPAQEPRTRTLASRTRTRLA